MLASVPANADISARDLLGHTALNCALYRSDGEMARLLVQRGADPSIRPLSSGGGYDGPAPLAQAVRVKNAALVATMLDRGARFTDASGVTRIRYTYANETLRLPHLQCRADQGERSAMVELARALEMGEGVMRDDVRAVALYEKAAEDRPSFTRIYSPPMRLGGSGQVMVIPNADGGPGDAEAKCRLGHMLNEGRCVGQDVVRGQDLTAAAQRQGFHP